MKKFIILLLIIAWPLLLSGQEKKAAKNKLKSTTVYEQDYVKGGGSHKESVVKYDEEGNIVEEVEYKLGKVVKHFVYQYDDQNNKIKEIEYDPAGKKIKVSEYKYTNNLRTEKAVYDANNKLLSKKTYQYETY